LVTKVDLAIIGVAIVGLFFVIRGAGQALSNLKLPDFSNVIGDIKFPDFSQSFENLGQGFTDAFGSTQDFFSDLQKQFTDFFNAQDTGASSIAGQDVTGTGEAVITIPEDTVVNPDGTVSSSTPPTSTDPSVEPGGLDPLGEISFNKLKSQVFNTLTQTIGLTPAKAFAQLKDLEFTKGSTFADLDFVLQSFNQPIDPALLGKSGAAASLPAISDQPVQSFLDIPQEFKGGGVGFIGGSVTETPIANLSLSQIIDKFNVSASQAANILAIAKDDFGNFDFGSNTGSGIGSVFQDPALSSILPQSNANVSNNQFQGLSLTQIALQLTGGNIQNPNFA